MKLFEHKIEMIAKLNQSTSDVIESIQTFDVLEAMGKNGWELVSTFTIGLLIYGCFKRELKVTTTDTSKDSHSSVS